MGVLLVNDNRSRISSCLLGKKNFHFISQGFVYGDSENKRRRYCLMCNVFKPERCHHCSACNRCVLNMDHHCPWINNCVGFWNRKYFILLLIYTWLTTIFVLASSAYDIYLSIKWVSLGINGVLLIKEIELFVYDEHVYS